MRSKTRAGQESCEGRGVATLALRAGAADVVEGDEGGGLLDTRPQPEHIKPTEKALARRDRVSGRRFVLPCLRPPWSRFRI
jgi:hypothetical protein